MRWTPNWNLVTVILVAVILVCGCGLNEVCTPARVVSRDLTSRPSEDGVFDGVRVFPDDPLMIGDRADNSVVVAYAAFAAPANDIISARIELDLVREDGSLVDLVDRIDVFTIPYDGSIASVSASDLAGPPQLVGELRFDGSTWGSSLDVTAIVQALQDGDYVLFRFGDPAMSSDGDGTADAVVFERTESQGPRLVFEFNAPANCTTGVE